MQNDSIQKIHEDLKNFNELEICNTCLNPVMGRGSDSAQIMFIGEAPGAEEDKQAKPFVGRSGKLLSQMLLDSGINEDSVYITNIVKFRPPKNRDPNKEEKEACLPFLIREIQLIKPKIIAPLGRHAMNYFLPDQQISNIRGSKIGKETEWNSAQIFFPLYHPAVGLYNPNTKKIMLQDFKNLSKLLNSL